VASVRLLLLPRGPVLRHGLWLLPVLRMGMMRM